MARLRQAAPEIKLYGLSTNFCGISKPLVNILHIPAACLFLKLKLLCQ